MRCWVVSCDRSSDLGHVATGYAQQRTAAALPRLRRYLLNVDDIACWSISRRSIKPNRDVSDLSPIVGTFRCNAKQQPTAGRSRAGASLSHRFAIVLIPVVLDTINPALGDLVPVYLIKC